MRKHGTELPQTQVISPQFSHAALAELEGEGRAKGPPSELFSAVHFRTHTLSRKAPGATHLAGKPKGDLRLPKAMVTVV